MITIEIEYYIRFVLLLIKGGTDVLRLMLKRHLEKKNLTFGEFLSQFESKIKNARFLTNKQLKILYPVPTEPPDLHNCDISILAYLLNEFVTTKGSSVSKAVDKIRKFRNEFFAHPKTASLEAELFNSIWTTLSMAIRAIARDFTENERERFEETIERLSNVALVINSAVVTLSRLDQTDEFNGNINIRLTEPDQAVQYCHQDIELMKKQIIELQKTVENQGMRTKVVHRFDARNPLCLNSGAVCETSDEVYKIGTFSGITRGSFALQRGAVVMQGDCHGMEYKFMNLQKVENPFAEHGDYGALVMIEVGLDLIAFGILEGRMYDSHCVFVTPIRYNLLVNLRAFGGTELKLSKCYKLSLDDYGEGM